MLQKTGAKEKKRAYSSRRPPRERERSYFLARCATSVKKPPKSGGRTTTDGKAKKTGEKTHEAESGGPGRTRRRSPGAARFAKAQEIHNDSIPNKDSLGGEGDEANDEHS